MSKRRTAKERTLARYPGAWLWLDPQAGYYFVMPRRGYHLSQGLGDGDSPRRAWANAARNLSRRKK